MKSSSVHRINSDNGLNKWMRKLWFAANSFNNEFRSGNKSNYLNVQTFSPVLTNADWKKFDYKQSPSRALSNFFWMKLPWSNIANELGKIHILDIGCGKGNYGERLQSYSDEKISSYVGIDVEQHSRWTDLEKKYPYISFSKIQTGFQGDQIPEKTNLIITQSAIEHIPDDLSYFKEIAKFIEKKKEPFIQIHIFPSEICLKLFQLHGVRQYYPRTISKITNIFKEYSYADLFQLGDTECNELHWNFISRPIYFDNIGDLRDSKEKEYSKLVRDAITKDITTTNPSQAGFYALLIHSFSKTKIQIATKEADRIS